jgi:hypothetical protein
LSSEKSQVKSTFETHLVWQYRQKVPCCKLRGGRIDSILPQTNEELPQVLIISRIQTRDIQRYSIAPLYTIYIRMAWLRPVNSHWKFGTRGIGQTEWGFKETSLWISIKECWTNNALFLKIRWTKALYITPPVPNYLTLLQE